MTAVRSPFQATGSMFHAKHAGSGAAVGTACGRVSVVLLDKDSLHCRAGWSTCCVRRRELQVGVYEAMTRSRRRSRMLVVVCSFSARDVATVKWMEPSEGVNILDWDRLSAAGGIGSSFAGYCLAQPFPAQPWFDDRVKQASIFTTMLLWSILPDSTFMLILGFAYTLAVSALPRYRWQNDRCGTQPGEKQDGLDTDQARCLSSSGCPKLEISEMASLGALTFNFDSLLAKVGLIAFGCVLLVGLFNVGYSVIGVTNGHSVRRRVIRAQRHGDFRDRLRKRLGEREWGFRVTYQQPLPGSYFSGQEGPSVPEELFDEAYGIRKEGPSVPEELFDEAYGARNSMTRSEAAQLRRPKAARDCNKSTSVGRQSLASPSHNGSAHSSVVSQVTTQAEISQSHVNRLSSNPSLINKERRAIASKPGNLQAGRTISEAGVNRSSEAPSGGVEDKVASARTGSLRKWHQKDELELKTRVEELRRKVLAAEQTRQAAIRSLAEEKRRSLDLEVKISRQKESAMALEEEVRVLKESHEALLTSLRKKYSSSVAARAAAALLYQNWDSSDDNSMREMVH